MIRIAQASSSEVHTASNPGKFGTPPNTLRTGVTKSKPYGNMDGELNVRQWYPYAWEAVFRPSDPAIAEKMAWAAERAVMNHKYVGYGQNWIDDKYPMCGLYDAVVKLGTTDPLAVKRLVNTTCCTLISAVAYCAGLRHSGLRLMNTTSQPSVLMATKAFVKLTDNALLTAAVGTRRGDVFWKHGHTMIVLDDDNHRDAVPYALTGCKACNLRTGPGTKNGIITTLSGGDIVSVISRAEDDDGDTWYQVNAAGKIGYVSGLYIRDHLPTATVTGDMWLRTVPGDLSEKTRIIVIPRGNKECYLTGSSKRVGLRKWYECIYADRRGWASGLYIKA